MSDIIEALEDRLGIKTGKMEATFDKYLLEICLIRFKQIKDAIGREKFISMQTQIEHIIERDVEL